MNWPDFWAYFNASSNNIKAYVWQQLDLPNHLKGLSAKHQKEVLQGAPDDVIRLVENVLYIDVRIALSKTKKKLDYKISRIVLG